MSLVALQHAESPQTKTRDQTHVPCIGRWTLSPWITREVPRGIFITTVRATSLLWEHKRGSKSLWAREILKRRGYSWAGSCRVKRNCPIGGGGSRNVARLRDIKEHSFLRHGELNMYQGMALCEISVRTNAQRPREVMLYPKDSEGPCRFLSRRECKMRYAFDFIRSDRSQVKTLTRRFLAQRMGCSSVLWSKGGKTGGGLGSGGMMGFPSERFSLSRWWDS